MSFLGSTPASSGQQFLSSPWAVPAASTSFPQPFLAYFLLPRKPWSIVSTLPPSGTRPSATRRRERCGWHRSVEPDAPHFNRRFAQGIADRRAEGNEFTVDIPVVTEDRSFALGLPLDDQGRAR